MDTPPVPRYGPHPTPGESIRFDILPICARYAKLCLFHNQDYRTVSGKGARIDLEELGRLDRCPKCCGECLHFSVFEVC